jgi:hypothetical protein
LNFHPLKLRGIGMRIACSGELLKVLTNELAHARAHRLGETPRPQDDFSQAISDGWHEAVESTEECVRRILRVKNAGFPL